MSEITYNSKMSSCCWITWIHDYEIIYEIILWIHLWIQCYEKYSELIIVTHGWSEVPIRYEIMVDFINLELIWIQHQICFSEGKVLLRQCNNGPFFAPSFLPAPRLLHCCCCCGTGGCCCNCRCQVLQHTVVQGGRGGPFKQMKTSLALRSALHHSQQWRKLRNLQVDWLSTGNLKGLNLKDTIQKEQSDLQKAFRQENAKDGIAVHNSKYCPKNDVGIYWIKFSWRMPSTMHLTAALCQHRHKQDAGCY